MTRPDRQAPWQPLLVAAAVLALSGLAEPAGAQTDGGAEEARALAARVLESGAYQTELPAPRPPEWVESLARRDRFWSPAFLQGFGFAARLLLWLLVGAVVVAAAVWLARATGRVWPGLDSRESAAAEGREPAAGRAPPADLARAEALAAEGRYPEAARALLLLAFARVARRHDRAFPASATAREVLRAVRLPGPARDGLAELVATVERSLFGGLPLRKEDWTRCRAAFGALVEAV